MKFIANSSQSHQRVPETVNEGPAILILLHKVSHGSNLHRTEMHFILRITQIFLYKVQSLTHRQQADSYQQQQEA